MSKKSSMSIDPLLPKQLLHLIEKRDSSDRRSEKSTSPPQGEKKANSERRKSDRRKTKANKRRQ
jgi:hypothetical protein